MSGKIDAFNEPQMWDESDLDLKGAANVGEMRKMSDRRKEKKQTPLQPHTPRRSPLANCIR